MGEISLIQQFRKNAPGHAWLATGPGDDCAVLRWPGGRDQVFKIDQIVEGTHFLLNGPAAATLSEVGWKAMAKACSDIAAMGFWPVAATVALNLRRGSSEKIALELYEGLVACCRCYKFALAGGDLCVSENSLAITVSMLGEGPESGAWLRSGAQPGDWLLVTGSLGASQATRKHLTFSPRLEEAARIRQIAGAGVHACIDVTDGLSRDLRHVCEESGCGALVFQEKVPCAGTFEQALGDGEDFELLLAVEPSAADLLLRGWTSSVPLTRIGTITPAAEGCIIAAPDGSSRAMPNVGYEHTP